MLVSGQAAWACWLTSCRARERVAASAASHGVHQGFLLLGVLTLLSNLVIGELRRDDGESVSRQKPAQPTG